MIKTTPFPRLLLCFIPLLLISTIAIELSVNQVNISESLSLGSVVSSSKGSISLDEIDFILEPGEINEDDKLKKFFQRQDEISKILADESIFNKKRSYGDIPWMFWIQLTVGVGAVLISGLVWALKPKDLANIFFLISGFSTLLFTSSAAVYTTRALALSSDIFSVLVKINVFGASLYGISTISLFLIYPIKLHWWKPLLYSQILVFGLWTSLSIVGKLPAAVGVNLITLVEMFFILIAIGAQFYCTRKDLRARASFAWLSLSVLVGAGAFISLNALPLVLGSDTPFLDQGTSFLLFLLIYLGIAAGLRKFRLFDVGNWSFKLLFFAIGSALVLALDAVLVMVWGMSKLPSLGSSLIFVCFLYLPLRDSIWRGINRREKIDPQNALKIVLDVVLAPELERSTRWISLIKEYFSPLEISDSELNFKDVEILEDGISLFLPAVSDCSGLKLTHAQNGKSLFNMEDKLFAHHLIKLIKQAETNREAYERGVTTERKRMAQDLHDDVGSRLLTGFHLADEKTKPMFQSVINDIRAIVLDLSMDKMSLLELIANLRFEASERLAIHNIKLYWPIYGASHFNCSLDYRQYKAISSCLKEVISNVIKHSGATEFSVEFMASKEKLKIVLIDNGRGMTINEQKDRKGHGLINIQKRMTDACGVYKITSSNSGTLIDLELPLK